MLLTEWKDLASIAQSAAATAAVVAGGVWAVHKFKLKRELYPKARVSHKFTEVKIDDERRVLRVDLTVENVGEKLLHLRSITSRLQQVLPLASIGHDGARFKPEPTSSAPEIDWPQIHCYQHFFKVGEREVEPGETETFQFDYIIVADLQVVQAYSYVTNPAKWKPSRLWGPRGEPPEIGWHATEMFSLTPTPETVEGAVSPPAGPNHIR